MKYVRQSLTENEANYLLNILLQTDFKAEFFGCPKYSPYSNNTEDLISILRFGYKPLTLPIHPTITAAHVKDYDVIPLNLNKMKRQLIRKTCNLNKPPVPPSLGVAMESMVISLWRQKNRGKFEIRVCKGIVNPHIPAVSCSSDGFIVEDEQVIALVEVKGIRALSIDGTMDFEYFFQSGFSNNFGIFWCQRRKMYQIRRSSVYYKQIQYQLLISNIKICYLLIYSKLDNDLLEIPVYFDKEYLIKSYSIVVYNYKNFIIPFFESYNVHLPITE